MSYVIPAPMLAVQKKSDFEKKIGGESTNATENISSKIYYNVETDGFCKNITKIALSAQYYMSCPNDPKVICVLVSIKFHIGNDLDQGHYLCDVLDYNTGTWWKCDDEIVIEYPGYPMNV